MAGRIRRGGADGHTLCLEPPQAPAWSCITPAWWRVSIGAAVCHNWLAMDEPIRCPAGHDAYSLAHAFMIDASSTSGATLASRIRGAETSHDFTL